MSLAILTNNNVATQPRGSVVRLDVLANTCLMAQADTLAHCQNLVGTRLADVSASAGGVVGSLTNGMVVLLDGAASAGDTVYLSATVAGRGTNTPPGIQVVLGYAYAVQLVSGNYYASLAEPVAQLLALVARTSWATAITVTHTFNPSARTAVLEGNGAGGAGGGALAGSAGNMAVGGGGGSGAYFNVDITLGSVRTCTVVVGAGGAGASGAVGGNGASTTITYDGTTYTATPGTGGSAGSSGSSFSLTNHGGRGLGGVVGITQDGSAGGLGIRLSGTVGMSGTGGSTHWSGMIGSITADQDGVPALTGGGGGCGAVAFTASNRKGGDGAPGLAIITEYS